MIARRAPNTIAAVHYALTNGKGSKKAIQAYPKVGGAPGAVQTEVENHLRRLKKEDPPDGDCPNRVSHPPPPPPLAFSSPC